MQNPKKVETHSGFNLIWISISKVLHISLESIFLIKSTLSGLNFAQIEMVLKEVLNEIKFIPIFQSP